MKKKFLLVASVVLISCLPFVFSNTASAEEEMGKKSGDKVEITTLADINLSELVVAPLEQNKFRLSFIIENRMDIQSELVLGVELFRREAGSDKVIFLDQESFPSNLVTIGKDEKIQKKITYQAPEYLSGKAELWLKINDPSGINLALISASVELRGDGKYLEFSNPCYLKVTDPASEVKTDDWYDLSQGVDVSREEGLSLVCMVKSYLEDSVTVKPAFEAHLRDKFGREVGTESIEQGEYQFAKEESREITIPLPKPEKPQAYEIITSLTTDEAIISNSVVAHFVIIGPSGTISSVSLEKDYYQKNEQAGLTLLVSGSADVFPGARYGGMRGAISGGFFDKLQDGVTETVSGQEVTIDMKDGNNQACGQRIELPAQKFERLSKIYYPVDKKCYDPIFIIRLKDENKLYDERMLKISSSEGEKSDDEVIVQTEDKTAGEKKSKWLTYAVGGFSLMFIFSLIFIFWKRKKCNIAHEVPLVFLLGIFFGQQAMGATLLVDEVGLYERQLAQSGKMVIVSIAECESRDSKKFENLLKDCRTDGSASSVDYEGDADRGDARDDRKGFLLCPSESTDFVCGRNETIVTVGTTKKQYEKSNLADEVIFVSSVSGMRMNNNDVATMIADSAPYIGNAKYDTSGSCSKENYEKPSDKTDILSSDRRQYQTTNNSTKQYDNELFKCGDSAFRYMLEFRYAEGKPVCFSNNMNMKCPTFSCGGNQPALPQIKCPKTKEAGLSTKDYSWRNVGDSESLCAEEGICEYYTSLEKKFSCSGISPIEPQKKCLNTKETGLPIEVPWTNVGNKPNDCTFGGGVCEFYGEMLYSCQGEMPAPPQQKCPNTKELGLSSEVIWHSVGSASSACAAQGQCEFYAP